MATQKRRPIHSASRCTKDATDCTKEGRHGDRSQNIDKKWRDHEIYRLHVAGKSNAEISKLVGCHRNTVANGIKSGAVPASTEAVVEIEELDRLGLGNLKAFLTSDDGETRETWTRWYFERRSILGEPKPANGVNINVGALTPDQLAALEELREAKLANGLSKHKGAVIEER